MERSLPSGNMANDNDKKICEWLTSKLESPWSSGNIGSQLSEESLAAIDRNFYSLDTLVKLRLVISFLYLSKGLRKEFNNRLEAIIGKGCNDTDPWVNVLYSMFKLWPSTTQLSCDSENALFQRSVAEIEASSTIDNPFCMLWSNYYFR